MALIQQNTLADICSAPYYRLSLCNIFPKANCMVKTSHMLKTLMEIALPLSFKIFILQIQFNKSYESGKNY